MLETACVELRPFLCPSDVGNPAGRPFAMPLSALAVRPERVARPEGFEPPTC
jgi:hypothetical protein